jgi:type IV pilus assembly protein PilM
MARGNDSWGIEVGTNAIKAIHLTRTGGAKGKVQMVAHEVIPFKKILTTPDLNVNEAIKVNLDQLLARHALGKSTVTISVPGHMAFARFAKLPPVPPKDVPKVVRYEAVQQIPFPIEQVEWDYQVFQQDDMPDVEVGIFAITKEKVMNYLTNYNAVNLRVDALTLSPLAVFNAFVYDTAEDPPSEGVIYMDIGTTATDVIIVEEGGIWLRTLPLGGNTFTEALVKAFKLSYNKAEKLKKEAATSKYARQIFQAMRPVFADLVQELQRSLGYYQSLNRDANLTKVVCVGSTFKLPGLQKFLKQQLQMDVERPDAFKRISVDDKHASEFAGRALNMATAYGLALQGLGLETVSANILPSHIIRQRMWKAKQPWIAAAAACFVVAAGITAATAMRTSGALDSGVQAAKVRFAPVDNRASELKQRFDQIDTTSNPRQKIENLRRVLESRQVWPMLLEDINAACLALDPGGEQPEVWSNNYESIAKVPRAERKRIYIKSITAKYEPGGDAAAEDGGAMGMGMDPMGMDDMGMGPGMDPMGMGPGMDGMGMGAGMDGMGYDAYGSMGDMGMGGGMMGDSEFGATHSIEDFFGEGKKPPRLIVTVRGTTPNAQGSKFLEDNFVGWLKDHAEQPGRPYRFVVGTNVVKNFGSMAAEKQEGVGGPGGVYGAESYEAKPGGAYPGGGYGEDKAGYPGGGFDQGYPSGAYPGGGGGAGGVAADLAALLPSRPLADEDRSQDGQFELRWTVELLNPTTLNQPVSQEPDDLPGDQPADQPGDNPPNDQVDQTPTAVIPRPDEIERGES